MQSPVSISKVARRITASAALCFTLLSSQAWALETMNVKVGKATFRAEVVESVEDRARGLMNVKEMAPQRGMLFIQPGDRPAYFWMKNTLISLDLLYFDEGKVLRVIHADTPPCVTPRCPSYGSDVNIKYVLEINGGMAEKWGIEVGEVLNLPQNN